MDTPQPLGAWPLPHLHATGLLLQRATGVCSGPTPCTSHLQESANQAMLRHQKDLNPPQLCLAYTRRALTAHCRAQRRSGGSRRSGGLRRLSWPWLRSGGHPGPRPACQVQGQCGARTGCLQGEGLRERKRGCACSEPRQPKGSRPVGSNCPFVLRSL